MVVKKSGGRATDQGHACCFCFGTRPVGLGCLGMICFVLDSVRIADHD